MNFKFIFDYLSIQLITFKIAVLSLFQTKLSTIFKYEMATNKTLFQANKK